jgi:hypothetical protein
MKALNDFPELILVIILIIGGVVFWAKTSFQRHDLIVDYIKKNGGILIEKEWYTRNSELNSSDTYYIIKYYDKNKKLHKTQLTVDEFKNETLVKEDKIIS